MVSRRQKNSVNGVIILIVIFLNSCQTNKDPIASVPFGKISVTNFLEKFSKRSLIEIIEDSSEEGDVTVFYKLGGDSKLKSKLVINPGRFKFETVNSLEIFFGSDSVRGFFEETVYRPGKGEIGSVKLNSVIDLLKEWHGEPNLSFRESEFFEEIHEVIKAKKKQEETIQKKGKLAASFDAMNGFGNYLVWELDGFNLMISYRENIDDSLYSFNSIRYEIKEFQNVLEKEKEELLKSAELNDYIDMRLNLDSFTEGQFPYTDRLNLSAIGIGHKLPEEERDIRRFKFDAIFKNEYDDQILLIKDVDLELESPLQSPSSGLFRKTTGGYSYSVFFNRNNSNSQDYEKLRRLREQKVSSGNFSDIKVEYQITAIIFEDGEVLKK